MLNRVGCDCAAPTYIESCSHGPAISIIPNHEQLKLLSLFVDVYIVCKCVGI